MEGDYHVSGGFPMASTPETRHAGMLALETFGWIHVHREEKAEHIANIHFCAYSMERDITNG